MIKVFIKSVVENVIGKLFTGVGSLESEYTNRNMYQQSGLSSIPKEGDQGIIIKQGNNYACIATDTPQSDRPVLVTERDVCIYASNGDFVKINGAGGKIEIISSADIDIKSSGTVNVEGDGTNGSVKLGGGLVANLMKDSIISKYNIHVHTETGATTTVPTVLWLPADATTEVQGS